MKGELERLDQAVGSMFRVVGVEEGSQAQQMALAVARTEKVGGLDPIAQREINPGAILATGQFNGVGGPQTRVCVVVLDPERAAMAWETYVIPPAAAGSHPQTGVAWMAGHAVGHCLDAYSRHGQLVRKMAWRPKDVSALGLWPNAVQAVTPAFGGSFSKDGFLNNAERIYSQPTQHQFSERGADIFATLWVTRLGATKAGIEALALARKNAGGGDDAGIQAVLQPRALARAGSSPRADRLWDMARDLQLELGVDSAALATSKLPDPAAGAVEPEITHWVITARGVVGVDSQGREVKMPNTTQQVGPGHNFKDLPRFGED
jgi:hypothetical protein